MVNAKIKLITFLCCWRWRSCIQLAKIGTGPDCGSDHQFFRDKFRLTLQKVGNTTRPVRYDLNQILYEYAVEVVDRFKGLDLVKGVPEELWIEAHDTVNYPKEKEKQEGKVVIWGDFTNSWRKQRSEKQGER